MLRRNKTILSEEELRQKSESGQTSWPGLTTGSIEKGSGHWDGRVWVSDPKPRPYAQVAMSYFGRDGISDLDRKVLLQAHQDGLLANDDSLRQLWERSYPPSQFRDRSYQQFLDRLDAELLKVEPKPESERDRLLRIANEALESKIIERNRQIRNLEARSASGGPA